MADQVWYGCVVPDDLLYDVGLNVWVRLTGGVAELGMTDVAQTMGGRMVQVGWKRTGRVYPRGKSLAVIESAKWVGPFPTPLTGELIEVNEAAFAADIAIVNRDPYGAGWLARLRPSDLARERQHLVDGTAAFAAYRDIIEERQIRCFRCADLRPTPKEKMSCEQPTSPTPRRPCRTRPSSGWPWSAGATTSTRYGRR